MCIFVINVIIKVVSDGRTSLLWVFAYLLLNFVGSVRMGCSRVLTSGPQFRTKRHVLVENDGLEMMHLHNTE